MKNRTGRNVNRPIRFLVFVMIIQLVFTLSACNNTNTTQPIETSPQSTGITTQTPVPPTMAALSFRINCSPVPDLENPGELSVTFNTFYPERYQNLDKSSIVLEFYWTNIHGSYSEAKRAELVPINEVLVSGDVTWEGDASVNPSITLRSQIKLPREGVWKIKAMFSSNNEIHITDYIKVAVADGTSAIMQTKEFKSSPLAYLGNLYYGEGGDKILSELNPVVIDLDISKSPRTGEEAILTYRIRSLYEVTDFSTQFRVYKRTEGNTDVRVSLNDIVLGGVLTWQGDLIPGEPVVVTSSIIFPEEGGWRIGVYGNSSANKEINLSGYSDYIKINVTDIRGSFGWEEPKPVTIIPTTTTPTTIIPTTTIISETATETTTNPQH